MSAAGPYKRRWLHTVNQRVAASRTGAAIFARLAHHLDRPAMRLSRGRFSLGRMLTGVPIVMLTTIGAKSGQLRSVPVIGIQHGDEVVLVGSNWGRAGHPAWYRNLRVRPRALLMIGGRSRPYVAREVTGIEREAYWRKAIDVYPGYAAYVQRTAGRTIPVVVLTPAAE